MGSCCIKDCQKPILAKGMCAMHYARMRRGGDPTKTALNQFHGGTLIERFEHYVVKSDGCWQWTGSVDKKGYGRLNVDGKPVLAHRIAWSLFRHEITSAEHVLHRCDNPPCCNPSHLFLGTHADNMADKMAKGRHRYGTSHGSAHGMSKLTEAQVLEIRASAGPSRIEAEKHGISGRTVRDIRNRQIWKHLN